jgi:nicotinamide mononucleotide (NMN) deamidase PncC
VDICLSDTGIAGPGGGSASKPLGLFYIGLACPAGTFNRERLFKGDRVQNKESAADEALCWLRDFLSGGWVPKLP